jgi:hypothetical protein
LIYKPICIINPLQGIKEIEIYYATIINALRAIKTLSFLVKGNRYFKIYLLYILEHSLLMPLLITLFFGIMLVSDCMSMHYKLADL